MAGERTRLEVKRRDDSGSGAARRLRQMGFVPGVLYGGGQAASPFYVEERELRRVLTGEHGLHAILDVVLDGNEKPHHAVLKDYQLDPTRPRLLHVDLHEVRLDRPIQSAVIVEPVGTAEGVTQGGVQSLLVREVMVEALPMAMPDRLELDVSQLTIGDSLRVSDLSAPDGVTILDDGDSVLVTITPPTRVEEPVLAEEELEGEEAAAEAAAGAPAEQPGEPESEATGE